MSQQDSPSGQRPIDRETTGQLFDHPERLGVLADVFQRRRIVMAADGEGRLVLIRPDSVVVDAGSTASTFATAVKRIAEFYPDQAEELRKAGRKQGGLIRVAIPGAELTDRGGEARWSADLVQDVITRFREAGLTTEANHVMLASQGVKGSPVGAEAHYAADMMFTADTRQTPAGTVLLSTSEPAVAPVPLRAPLALVGHRAPQVLVLDTGLRTTDAQGVEVEHPELGCVRLHNPWFKDPTVEAVDDEDEFDDDNSGFLDFEAGHGTFISGIIRQICPDAEVHIGGVLSSFGDGDVASVVGAFERALSHAGPFDLVVMSLGGVMTDDDGTMFGRALTRLLRGGLGVAAAGNQGTSRPYYPAALPDIIGVGALGENDKAWFTNFGGWVDACAPGIDVVSTFFTAYDEERFEDEPGRSYRGWARWSGTSFAAPKVAAAIAHEMYLTNSTARQAWKRLSNYKRYRFPDLGTVFNV